MSAIVIVLGNFVDEQRLQYVAALNIIKEAT